MTFQKGARSLTTRICLYALALVVLASAAIAVWWRQHQTMESPGWVSASQASVCPAQQCHPLGVNVSLEQYDTAEREGALVLIGATITDQLLAADKKTPARERAKTITLACLLRLGILPVCYLMVMTMVPATDDLKRVVSIEIRMKLQPAALPWSSPRCCGGVAAPRSQPAQATANKTVTNIIAVSRRMS